MADPLAVLLEDIGLDFWIYGPDPNSAFTLMSFDYAAYAARLRAAGVTPPDDTLRQALDYARLVSQWHGAIGSGPIEVLDAELGELGRLVRAALTQPAYLRSVTGADSAADSRPDMPDDALRQAAQAVVEAPWEKGLGWVNVVEADACIDAVDALRAALTPTPRPEEAERGAEAFDAAVQRAFAGTGVTVRTSFTPSSPDRLACPGCGTTWAVCDTKIVLTGYDCCARCRHDVRPCSDAEGAAG